MEVSRTAKTTLVALNRDDRVMCESEVGLQMKRENFKSCAVASDRRRTLVHVALPICRHDEVTGALPFQQDLPLPTSAHWTLKKDKASAKWSLASRQPAALVTVCDMKGQIGL
jgi:hypothetical protein